MILLTRTPTRHSCCGFTLIELVVVIVVFGIAAAGIASIYIGTTARSADPALRAQAQAIAVAYMDEIMLQKFCEDPDNGCANETGGSEDAANNVNGSGDEDRSTFDDVFDYDGIDEPPTDRTGTLIGGRLDNYNVTVSVADSGKASPNASPARITVTVTDEATNRVDYRVRSDREDY